MNPLPIPVVQIPNPNGYDDFLNAAKILPAQPIVSSNGFDPNTATQTQFEQAVAEIRPALDRARRGLSLQVMAPLDYSYDSLNMATIGEFRTMGRGFNAQGRLAAKTDEWPLATEHWLDGARFGLLLSRGGLMVDDLVGIACTGVACRGLYGCIDHLSVDKLSNLIDQLHQFETYRDMPEEFVYRDAIWSEHAMGWYGHFTLELTQLLGRDVDSEEGYRQARNRELAILRLLQLELALRLYKYDHGQHPDSLDALVPKYIEAVPIDPMSPNDEPLRSVQTENGIISYSIGSNGIDDQGQADPDDQTFGDLRLDVLWSSQTVVGQRTAVHLSDIEDELEFEAEPDEQD